MPQPHALQVDDYESAVETFYERGWTDGLPVVPPTRKLVEAMIAASGPTATDNFEKAARTAARAMGVPGMQFAVIERLHGQESMEEQLAKADAALPDIVNRLLASISKETPR